MKYHLFHKSDLFVLFGYLLIFLGSIIFTSLLFLLFDEMGLEEILETSIEFGFIISSASVLLFFYYSLIWSIYQTKKGIKNFWELKNGTLILTILHLACLFIVLRFDLMPIKTILAIEAIAMIVILATLASNYLLGEEWDPHAELFEKKSEESPKKYKK